MNARALYMGTLDHSHWVACRRCATALACFVVGSRLAVRSHCWVIIFFKFCSVSDGFLYNFSTVICHLFSLMSNSVIISDLPTLVNCEAGGHGPSPSPCPPPHQPFPFPHPLSYLSSHCTHPLPQIQLGDLGSSESSPIGSEQSPAAKCRPILVQLWLKLGMALG